VAVVIAIKGSRIARSRPTAARMRGRSKAKRLERATREPHNWFRRPIELDTDSGLCYWLHPSRKSRLVGSAEAETAWRERPHLWPRARSQTRSDLVVAHATATLCVAAQGSVAPTGRPKAPPGILRSEITDPAGVTALKRRGTGFGNRPSRSAGKIPGGGTPRATPCSPLRSPINLGDAGLAGCQGRNSQLAGHRSVRTDGHQPTAIEPLRVEGGPPAVRNLYRTFGQDPRRPRRGSLGRDTIRAQTYGQLIDERSNASGLHKPA
jgi:hypothetical protein